MAAGPVSESWARQIAAWSDGLPDDQRDEADAILLEAAGSGVPPEDLAVLARSIEETWTARFYRDSRLLSIGGGADEVMLRVLAREA